MAFYLDASVIVPLLAPEPTTLAIASFVVSVERCVVSDFALAELAAAVSRLVRTGEMPIRVAEARLHSFDLWCAETASPLAIGSQDVRRATELVRRFELMLRAPDALHLVLARRSGAALATFDKRMTRAAQAIGLPLAPIPS